MDKQSIINKIQAMMRLQENTTFEGEASAAAAKIDQLCKEYGLTVEDINSVIIDDSVFLEYKKRNTVKVIILCAVARFYDARAYYNGSELRVIGSEAQQIVVKIYFDFIIECMEAEAEKAHRAEKILAELTGQTVSRTYKNEFRGAFAKTVQNRLYEMKIAENRMHEHALAAKEKIESYKIKTVESTISVGNGTAAGADAGNSVSLYRQTNGASVKQLKGA